MYLGEVGSSSKIQAGRKVSAPAANVFATHEKFASGSSDGYVTVTAQGDGVHVLDLSTLHPVISHTLGPSTSFSCPSVTLSVIEGQQNIYTTYSAIASSADVTLEECGRTIWAWRENLSSPIGDRASQKKKAAVMPHHISEIYPCNGVPQRLLVLSPTGDLTVVDADLGIRGTVPPPPSSVTLLQSFVFSRESSPFLLGPPGSTVLVLVEHSQDATTNIRILDVSVDEGRDIGNTKIPVKSDLVGLFEYNENLFYIPLAKDGSWNSFQIESKNDGISVYSAAQPLRLKSLTFIGKSVEAPKSSEISIIALNTSLVLLAAITSSPTQTVVLLLWDLQYSVLLTSHVLAIPSTLSHLPKLSMTLRLVEATPPQALLILSPAADAQTKSSTTTRSNILVVPLTVPQMSTIGNAMGRAQAGAQWLVQPGANDTLGPARAQVLASIQTAMSNNDPQAAEAAFFDWEKSEQQSGEDNNGGGGEVRLWSSPVFVKALTSPQSQVALGHSFVHDILTTILQPGKQSSPYSSVLVRTLLQRRAVSASMVEGGLLAALKLRGDWFVAEHARKVEGADAMEVDPPPLGAIPKLSTFLNACVRYQTSPATLRAAMHQYLKQPEDVVAVLEVLDGWLGRSKGAEVIALPPKKSVHKDEHGIVVLKDGWQKDDDAAHPPLIKVDSCVILHANSPRRIVSSPAPTHAGAPRPAEGAFTDRTRNSTDGAGGHAEGPLELFARAQARAVREGKEGKKDLGDWRQRRRLAHERSAMAVGGVYQLEELVL
ncbi:hypothetical protein B0H13DRAFT_2454868 [Mycena leptocephala]|nr:hypothetical protein B0H13DRAFT_2454868 [Mycena leptocephala]